MKQNLCKLFTKRFGKDFTVKSAKSKSRSDICAPEGFLFSLESKNGYEDKVDLGNLFSSKNKTLDGFLKQAIKEAKECDRLPLMCWKRKRQPWVAFIKANDLLRRSNDAILQWQTRLAYGDWVCVALDRLLELPDEFFFEKAQGVSNMGTLGHYKLAPCCSVTVNAPEPVKEFSPTKKKNLLVGSLFIDDSPEQQKWLELQLEWLKSTTDNFDHVVRLTEPSESFSKITNVIVGKNQDHYSGIRRLLQFFKDNQDYYENFLFIDSDAFPVRENWLGILEKKMDTQEIAAIVRSENLEQRLHASVLFTKKAGLNKLEFPLIKKPILDLMGGPDNDVRISPYQIEERDKAFPLLRSNKTEVHPLLCGIYYDLFYHHGCGSRVFFMRAIPYWDHVVVDTDVQEFTDKLMDNPKNFIKGLTWNVKTKN